MAENEHDRNEEDWTQRKPKTIQEPQSGQSLKKKSELDPTQKRNERTKKKKNPEADRSLKQEERTEPGPGEKKGTNQENQEREQRQQDREGDQREPGANENDSLE